MMRILLAPMIVLCTLAFADATPEGPPILPVSDDTAVSLSAAVLDDGRLLCVWTTGRGDAPQTQVMGAYYSDEYGHWFGPRPMVRDAGAVTSVALATHPDTGELWLFTSERVGGSASVHLRISDSGGSLWSGPVTVHDGASRIDMGSAWVSEDGHAVGFTADGTAYAATSVDGEEWSSQAFGHGAASPPAVVAAPDGHAYAYAASSDFPHRYLRAGSDSWGEAMAVNLPNAGPHTARTAALLALYDGTIGAVAASDVTRPNLLQVLHSHDGGRVWPVRRSLTTADTSVAPALLQGHDGMLHALFATEGGGIGHAALAEDWANEPMTLRNEPIVATTVPPLWYPSHRNTPEDQVTPLPLEDTPFFEHVRHEASAADWPGDPEVPGELPGISAEITTPVVEQGGHEWAGTMDGLYQREGEGDFSRHPSYGFDGPLANRITGLGTDSHGTLWVATPGGLSTRDEDGVWRAIRGREGLPWKELTALAIDRFDRVWLGSTRGVILHDPAGEERQWYYRAGQRYLPDDRVEAVAPGDDGRTLFVRTANGYGRIVEEPLTLHDKAEQIEARYNERHRRLGLASPAIYESADAMDSWVHGPQPSDGLWTSYHVAAMGMAYSLTLEDRYRESAAESMEAMYLLQNVTGVEGLVARTLVAVDEPAADNFRDATNYHLTADGRYLWRDDVSSDQLDGHFLAFYAYFEHIAQFDPEKRARLEAQLRQVLDYILEHDYTIPDWNAERTMWGWWTPDLLNEHPIHWQETGIYAVMMLMFLKTGYYITEDEAYAALYRELIEEHDFLSLTLLEKKVFPDERNHSDTQLSAVAYYPYLQLEYDPFIRDVLHRASRRHGKVEVAQRHSFFAFVYATVDREDADVAGGVRTMREFPRDRRNFRMENSHRRDVTIHPRLNTGGNRVLVEVLPYDEHHFERWNQDPYEADTGGDGRLDGSGEHYLLPYWIARYHDLITAPTAE